MASAKRGGGESAICIFGGGSPKNFALQTEPQIQEVLGIEEKGHDYFLQITDARPDTRMSARVQKSAHFSECAANSASKSSQRKA